MNLVGIKVLHTAFGHGEIVQQTGTKIIVQFGVQTKSFIHPGKDSPFQTGFLSAEDSSLHAAIMDENHRHCAQVLSDFLVSVDTTHLAKKEEHNYTRQKKPRKKQEESLKKETKKDDMSKSMSETLTYENS